ncbi:HNH endonuclease [Paludifilum halophilum]|nr:HNH endonuclease [Paludifilum halophilum]
MAVGALLAAMLYTTTMEKLFVAGIQAHIDCINQKVGNDDFKGCGSSSDTASESETSSKDPDSQSDPKKEKGFFEKLGDDLSDTWDKAMEGAKAGYDTLSDGFQRVKDELSDGLQAEWGDFKEGSLKDQIKWFLDGSPLGSISGKLRKLTGLDLNQWIVDNPGATLLNVLGVGLLFVPLPGARPLGFSILGGSGVNGVLSGLSGHDVGSSMFYGGLAGMIGLGVGGAVYKGVGSLVGRYAGPFLSKWLPKSLGGGSGAFADLFSFDWMKEGTFNWKKALIGGGVIGALTFGGGLFLDKAVPPLAHAMKQLGWNIEVGGDGTLAMPWIRGADEAGENVNKAVGRGRGSKLGREELQKAVENYELKVETAIEKGEKIKYVTYADGSKHKVIKGKYAGETHPKTGVPYDDNGFPIFDEWSKFEYQLDQSKYLASDTEQFKEATRTLDDLLKRKPELEENFTDKQLKDIKAGKKKIRGLTWHHHQEPGKLQLVPTEIHQPTSHTGGRAIWGGGEEYR